MRERGQPECPDHLLSLVSSWEEFCARVDRLSSTTAKGDAFERLVQLYLILDPTYSALLASNVWRVNWDEVPATVQQALGLPDEDKGIDLVALDSHGRYWTVQAKYRSSSEGGHSWEELSTFAGLSAMVCKNVSYSIVATTRERGVRLLEDLPHVGFLTSDTWHTLTPAFFERARAYLGRLPPPGRSPRRPLEHQQAATDLTVRHFVHRRHRRGRLVMACGSGKTLVGYWIARETRASTVLIAVPTLLLLGQTLREWMCEMSADGRQACWQIVCGQEPTEARRSDEPELRAHDLGVPTTSPDELARWFRDRAGCKRGPRVVLTTYASAPRVAAAARRAGVQFDLALLDEAHRTAGRRGKQTAYLLDDANVSIRWRLSMTATERYLAGELQDVLSMDDEAMYGPIINQFSTAAAITRGVLCDYQVLTVEVRAAELARVTRLLDRGALVTPGGVGEARPLPMRAVVAAVAIARAVECLGVQRVITYHRSVGEARAFAEFQRRLPVAVPGFRALESYHVSGHQPASLRARVLRSFAEASAPAILTNARCLTEGVDLPAVDGLSFVDARRSRVDLCQGIGRVLRTSPGKERGYVIVPLVVHADGTPFEAAADSAWEELIWLLRRLALVDERVVEYFQAVASGRIPRWSPIRTAAEIAPETIDVRALGESVALRCWDRLQDLTPILPWRLAREAVMTMGIRHRQEYLALSKAVLRAHGLPPDPGRVYRGDWSGWPDFLGDDSGEPEPLPFSEARRLVRSFRFGTMREYQAWARVNRLPLRPDLAYPARYRSADDWLGRRRGSDRRAVRG